MSTVVTIVPKLITAIVVANFEASDHERREYIYYHQYYLEKLHLQELKLTRAIRILTETSNLIRGDKPHTVAGLMICTHMSLE